MRTAHILYINQLLRSSSLAVSYRVPLLHNEAFRCSAVLRIRAGSELFSQIQTGGSEYFGQIGQDSSLLVGSGSGHREPDPDTVSDRCDRTQAKFTGFVTPWCRDGRTLNNSPLGTYC
jgi:hypothetical protein